MSATLGRITAQLELPTAPSNTKLVGLINNNVNPPTPVSRDDVHIRALYIVSDEINSYGGCFPANEHTRLAELLVDSPVMVGHRKDRLPIGRNFHASVVRRGNRSWVKSYFYWLKSAHGAENLRENIDGGIYKECSIAFTYCMPECSVCGRDIRVCPHEPSRPDTDLPPCHFNYRHIERVLETSLVYRGAIPNTRIAKELSTDTIEQAVPDVELPYQLAIHFDRSTDRAYLIVKHGELSLCLQLFQFNSTRFQRGIRFLAKTCDTHPELLESIRRLPACLVSPHVKVDQATNKQIVLNLDSVWASQITICQLPHNDYDRFAVYCSKEGK